MPPRAHSSQEDLEGNDASSLAAPRANELDSGEQASESAATDAVFSIELNFNAYADNVPPTKHAKRVATYNDPSLQDFADQALELATLRAELKRLHRDYASLRHTMRVRDAQVHALREELCSLHAHARSSKIPSAQPGTEDVQSTRCHVQDDDPRMGEGAEASARTTLAAHETTIVDESLGGQELSSTLVLPSSPHAESWTSSGNSARRDSTGIHAAPGRKLVPVDHEGEAVPLNRDIITIGRTRQSDICIPSRAVSRDHARILVSPNGVMLFDRDSANGCFVNHESVKRQKLKDGDLVRIGDRSYRFTDDLAGAHRARTG